MGRKIISLKRLLKEIKEAQQDEEYVKEIKRFIKATNG